MRGQFSDDVDSRMGKMVRQHRNGRSRVAPLAGLVDFLVFLGRSLEYIRQARLHGVVDAPFATLAIGMHALLQQRIRPTEQHLMKCSMVLDPAAKITLLFILAYFVQELRKSFDVLVSHALYGDCR